MDYISEPKDGSEANDIARKTTPNQSHPYGVRQPPSPSHIIHAIIAVRMPEDALRDTNAPFSTSTMPSDGENKILCAVTSSKPPAKEKPKIPTKRSHW